jgi:Arc/MetJ-type ribon-helix-helix transcriptional regulator
MRSIINISVPEKVKAKVEIAVKQGGYATTSEFFRHLLRLWQENQALEELTKSRKQITRKRGKVLTSLKDLR